TPAAVLAWPAQPKPVAARKLTFPGHAHIPGSVIGRTTDALVCGEFTYKVFGQPGSDFLAELTMARSDVDIHCSPRCSVGCTAGTTEASCRSDWPPLPRSRVGPLPA